jgi:hypothetical protein
MSPRTASAQTEVMNTQTDKMSIDRVSRMLVS